MVLSLCDLADNAWVRVDLRSAIREGISVSRHELSLVVAAAIQINVNSKNEFFCRDLTSHVILKMLS